MVSAWTPEDDELLKNAIEGTSIEKAPLDRNIFGDDEDEDGDAENYPPFATSFSTD